MEFTAISLVVYFFLEHSIVPTVILVTSFSFYSTSAHFVSSSFSCCV